MTQEHEAVPASSNSNTVMVWIEYAFYAALIVGVFVIAYFVKTNRWQLLERKTEPPSAVEAS